MIRSDLIKERKAISPIIATLLLILIAIAAGVIVYAYVIGFVGGTSNNQATGASNISIDSVSGVAGSTAVTAYIRNIGPQSAIITAVYIVDTTGTPIAGGTYIGTQLPSAGLTCTSITSATSMACSVAPSATASISLTSVTGLVKGLTYQLKITMSDGSQVVQSFKSN
jgi:flagellin-like protein